MSPYSIQDELNLLDPKKIRIYRDEFNRLRLKFGNPEGNGEPPEVEVAMGFPLTNSEHFVSLVEVKDGKKARVFGQVISIGTGAP